MPTSIANETKRGGVYLSIDLLELFWRRRVYVVWFTLIGIFAGTLYCFLAKPIYESSAEVLVVQKRPQAVTGDSQYQSGFEDYLATHLAIVVSPLIVERAVEASNLGSLTSFADLENPEEELLDAIIDNLEVEGGSRDLGESANSIMSLSFRGTVAEDCPIVVQAILKSYEDFHHEVYRGMSDSTVNLISQASDLLKNDLANQEETYSSFRQSSPLVARGTEEVNPRQERLATIEQQLSELLLRRADVERQLLAINQAKQDGSDDEQMLAMISELRQQATTDTALPNASVALENQLLQLLDNEQKLMEHYGPNHPHVLNIQERIEAVRRVYALPTVAHLQYTKFSAPEELPSTDADSVDVYKRYLEQELNRLQISEKLLTDLYDREHEAAKELSIFQLKEESLHRNIDRTEELYNVVVNRLQEASLVKDFGGFETRVIAPPKLGAKVSPSRRILLPASAIAGMFLGCMLALLVETRDDSFQSYEQIQQQLGLPVVGQIPQFKAAPRSLRDTDSTGVLLDPMLCSYHQPRSQPAEAFRTLRTALHYNELSKRARVIQVAGPFAQDGASTVAANLAISLAQTGKRVLLIDADLLQQRQYQLFGIDRPETGLAAIIASEVEPGDVICQTTVENLSLLPAGALPSGPCEFFTSPRFGELINLVRDSYQYVLIDSGPLLTGSDPSVIASQTDGVLLTLWLTQDSRRRAKQAKVILDRLGVQVLGLVINRLSGSMLKANQMDLPDAGSQWRVTPPHARREHASG